MKKKSDFIMKVVKIISRTELKIWLTESVIESDN